MILTTAITWAILATGGAVAVYLLMRGEVRALGRQLAILTAERDKAIDRSKQYASAWGRIMHKLRFAERANLDLRTELIRRQTAEKEAA